MRTDPDMNRPVAPEYRSDEWRILVTTVKTCMGFGEIPAFYETGVYHPDVVDGMTALYIVERYGTKERAVYGHAKWVALLSYKKLSPEAITHVTEHIKQ